MTVTLRRTLAVLPGTFGLAVLVQALPFQCSIRVCGSAEPVWPTAHALSADVAETLQNTPPPGTALKLCAAQRLPFQCSINGVVLATIPGPGPISPTAQALLADVAATALK